MDVRIVFLGSPEFSIPILEALHKFSPVVGVVTQPDRPTGRGRKVQSPPIKLLADRLSIPVIQPQTLKNEDVLNKIKAWELDLIVVAAFGQILRMDVLNLPRLGCINVHASLLPRWRGASPIQAAILNGDELTGITIMKMDKGLDTGPILSQRSVKIQNEITGGDLSEQLASLGAELLIETLPPYIKGSIEPVPQKNQDATFTTLLNKSDGLLNFSDSAKNLVRKVRAFNPWPGTFFEFIDKILKVHNAHYHDLAGVIPGHHYVVDGKPAIGTQDGLLVLDQVQLAGKMSMNGEAFLNGIKNW